jgi:hypothetical protein
VNDHSPFAAMVFEAMTRQKLVLVRLVEAHKRFALLAVLLKVSEKLLLAGMSE